jgi:hypothetical protein
MPVAWPNCGRWSSAGCAAADLKGAGHARLDEYRWLLEELRVSLFAQELRTPQPVSASAWTRLGRNSAVKGCSCCVCKRE